MPVKRTIPYSSRMFFITFTCHGRMAPIDKVTGFDVVYNWFDHFTRRNVLSLAQWLVEKRCWEGVQVSFEYKDNWTKYAKEALKYVSSK